MRSPILRSVNDGEVGPREARGKREALGELGQVMECEKYMLIGNELTMC